PVPPQHDRDPRPAPARAARGHPYPGASLPPAARGALPQAGGRVRRCGHAGAPRASLARERARARPRRRALGPDGERAAPARRGPRAADPGRRSPEPRGDEPRGGRVLPHPQDPGAPQRQRQPGRGRPRPEPQRPVPPPAAVQAVTERAGRTRKRRPHEPRISHERRIVLMALLAGGAGVVVSMAVLWSGDFTPKVQWTLSAIVL